MSRAGLVAWLQSGYDRQPDLDNFQIWTRRSS
jgi:hypothetical protein